MKSYLYPHIAGAVLAVCLSSAAFGGAVIVNPAGTVALGINDHGHLNFESGSNPANASATGLAIITASGTRLDATAPGCLCEGWGVSGNGAAGYANVATDFGVNNLSLTSFSSTASTATSVVSVTSLPSLVVSQTYFPAPAAPGVLFQNKVTITNTGASTISNVRYVRVMDWDVPPTEFDELVTIRGTATTTLLDVSHNDGFATANPLASTFPITASTLNADFTDVGPLDHGAYFNFLYGDLAAGESWEFSVYYGASTSESAVLGALGDVGIELYSLGQSRDGGSTGAPYTFAFGFAGVGGTVVLPPSSAVPEPSTYGLMGAAALFAFIAVRRFKASRKR